jgi:hypothetical protein
LGERAKEATALLRGRADAVGGGRL